MRQSKVSWMRRHAKERAWERYGLDLTTADLCHLRLLIQTHRATLLKRQSLDRGVYEVEHKGKRMRIVYSKRHKAVVTVLPSLNTVNGM